MQMIAIPPHAPDIHQIPEHAIGATKTHVTRELNSLKRSVKNLSHSELQRHVREGAAMYTANSWMENMHRLMQCLRLISAPTDQYVSVSHHAERAGETLTTVSRRGTGGNYCYPDFS